MTDMLISAFQSRARATRRQLLVDGILKPVSALEHVDIAVPGYVGTASRRAGFA